VRTPELNVTCNRHPYNRLDLPFNSIHDEFEFIYTFFLAPNWAETNHHGFGWMGLGLCQPKPVACIGFDYGFLIERLVWNE
jgi:hypothetical protein